MDKRAYTTAEAAAYLGVSKDTIGRLASGNFLPVRYLNSIPLYDKADLDAYFEALPSERITT